MKLLKEELWNGVISVAKDNVTEQVTWLPRDQVKRCHQQVFTQVTWQVRWRVYLQLEGEIL